MGAMGEGEEEEEAEEEEDEEEEEGEDARVPRGKARVLTMVFDCRGRGCRRDGGEERRFISAETGN